MFSHIHRQIRHFLNFDLSYRNFLLIRCSEHNQMNLTWKTDQLDLPSSTSNQGALNAIEHDHAFLTKRSPTIDEPSTSKRTGTRGSHSELPRAFNHVLYVPRPLLSAKLNVLVIQIEQEIFKHQRIYPIIWNDVERIMKHQKRLELLESRNLVIWMSIGKYLRRLFIPFMVVVFFFFLVKNMNVSMLKFVRKFPFWKK